MKPYYQDENTTLYHGDCIEVMRQMPENSVDSIVADPPYGLGFMGKKWDALPPGEEWARECLRVLKPGGHILAFGGSRTWHRLAVSIEDAGFEIRDSIAWMHGQGFPKSMDVSKAIDKHLGAVREVTREGSEKYREGVNITRDQRVSPEKERSDTPATDLARQWKGWGTSLKPAFEPIVMGRKPLERTVAENILKHGVGALNIDSTRLPGQCTTWQVQQAKGSSGRRVDSGSAVGQDDGWSASQHPGGRHPANVLLDEFTAEQLDAQTGILKSGALKPHENRHVNATSYEFGFKNRYSQSEANEGGASRFFYCAKAKKSERPVIDGVAHPTVKPLTLMRYLVKLVTPVGGTVLDTFAGSGTTLEASTLEGFKSVGIEREAEYLPLIEARIARSKPDSQATLDLGDMA